MQAKSLSRRKCTTMPGDFWSRTANSAQIVLKCAQKGAQAATRADTGDFKEW